MTLLVIELLERGEGLLEKISSSGRGELRGNGSLKHRQKSQLVEIVAGVSSQICQRGDGGVVDRERRQ